MNLKETLITGKRLTHNTFLYKELFDKVKIYGIKSYPEAKYFIVNDLKEVPICPLSGEKQYFYINEYTGYSRKYHYFLGGDKHIKCEWLKWEKLFLLGLSLDEAKILQKNKTLLNTRLAFQMQNFNKNEIIKILKDKGYLDNAINNLINKDFFTLNGILDFVNEYNNLTKAKNNTLQHYINRGYEIDEAKDKLYELFNTYDKFINRVDRDSVRYKNWLESRKPGLQKTRSSLRSKFEKMVFNELKDRFDINLKFITRVNDPAFSKSIFKHDFFINNSLIVEYNGTYWHKDIFSDGRFKDVSLYNLEFLRANISINEHNCKYLILWEYDIKHDVSLVENLINNALNGKYKFYSSRECDIKTYKEIYEKE